MLRRRRAALTALIPFALAAFASPAAAAGSDADALFQQGLDAMRAGNYETACPLLDQSYRADPLPGALFTLAECENGWGKFKNAMAHYRAFVDMLPSLPAARRESFEERRRIAVEKIAIATAGMPEITIAVERPAASGLTVRRNGAVVEASAYGVTQKVDPGEYVISARTADGSAWERRVALAERDHVTVEIPSRLPRGAAAAEEVAPSAPTAPVVAGAPASGSSTRALAYLAGGIGVAGIATGAITGLVALADKSTVDSDCPNHLCNADGQRALNAGRTSSLVSTIAFPIGIVGLGAAAVLFIVSPSKSAASAAGSPSPSRSLRPSVAAGTGGASLLLEGSF
jgi:hypothetical protein